MVAETTKPRTYAQAKAFPAVSSVGQISNALSKQRDAERDKEEDCAKKCKPSTENPNADDESKDRANRAVTIAWLSDGK